MRSNTADFKFITEHLDAIMHRTHRLRLVFDPAEYTVKVYKYRTKTPALEINVRRESKRSIVDWILGSIYEDLDLDN